MTFKARFIFLIFILCAISYLIWWTAQDQEIQFLEAFLWGQIPSALAFLGLALRTFILADRQVPFFIVLQANAIALSGSLLVPAKLGEFLKPFFFNKRSNYPMPNGFVLVIKERILDIFGLCIYCGALSFFGATENYTEELDSIVWVLGGLSVGGLLFIWLVPVLVNVFPNLGKLRRYAIILRQVSFKQYIYVSLLSAVIFFSTSIILFVFHLFSGLPPLSYIQLALVFIFSTVGLVIGITPGGVGTYEAAIVSVLVFWGHEWQSALAFAIGFRVCWMFLPLVLGVWASLHSGFSILSQKMENT